MEQARRRMFRNDVSAETRAKQSVAHQGISKVNENHVYHQIIDTLLNNPILTLK